MIPILFREAVLLRLSLDFGVFTIYVEKMRGVGQRNFNRGVLGGSENVNVCINFLLLRNEYAVNVFFLRKMRG